MKLPFQEPAAKLRHDLRAADPSPDVRLRRAVVGTSLVGIACAAVTALFQMGLFRHLADPPVAGLDSDALNASDAAYSSGLPYSALSIRLHATAIGLAAAGGADRASAHPTLPLAAAAAALPGAWTAGKYLFRDLPAGRRRGSPYTIVNAITHLAVLGLTLVESQRALSRLVRR